MKTMIVLFLLFGLTSLAYADLPCSDAAMGEIVSAVEQPDQSVSLQLRMQLNTDDGTGYLCWPAVRVWRMAVGKNKKIIDADLNQIVLSRQPAGICSSDPLNCAEGPLTEDCDGDGTPECPDSCCTHYLYTISDTCAPVGLVSYHLSTWRPYYNEMDVECEGYVCQEKKLLLVTLQDNCTPEGDGHMPNHNENGCILTDDDECSGGDSDDDDDDDDVDDDNGNNDNDDQPSPDDADGIAGPTNKKMTEQTTTAKECGCGIQSDTSGLALFLVMVCIGLAAFFKSYKK